MICFLVLFFAVVFLFNKKIKEPKLVKGYREQLVDSSSVEDELDPVHKNKSKANGESISQESMAINLLD